MSESGLPRTSASGVDVKGAPGAPASSTGSSGSRTPAEFHSSAPKPTPQTGPQPQKELAAPTPRADAASVSTPAPTTQEGEPSALAPGGDLSSRLRPQWLDPGQGGQGIQEIPGGGMGVGSETLQRAKERVASRWFALKGLFTRSAPAAELSSVPKRERHVPVIAVFSFAGGVGKTSLIATLGRALASHGERVLLVDTTPFGLLPFYFGARDLKAGVVRTFTPPNNGIERSCLRSDIGRSAALAARAPGRIRAGRSSSP